jgi:hypothetical protein
MKPLLLLFFILIGYTDLSAQDSTYVTIKAGSKVGDVLTQADIYYYPKFTTGEIVFKEGKKIVVDMNYNRLFDQMLYINHKDDTLALADEKTIKFIAILKDTFYYDNGYVRIVTDHDFVKFAEKQVWIVADIRKIGTHNTPKNTVAITSFTAFTTGTDAAKSKDLILNEDIVLRKETQYYFGNAYNNFVRAGKKRIEGLFPKEELSIANYLKKNKVDFDKKEDLEKLAQFLSDQY